MASSYLVLGQNSPSSSTNTDLYVVPSATSTVISTLVICNRGVTAQIRVAIRKSGAAIDPKHYIVYDQYINANDSIFLTIGLSLATTDVVTIYSSTSTVSFSLYGTEIV